MKKISQTLICFALLLFCCACSGKNNGEKEIKDDSSRFNEIVGSTITDAAKSESEGHNDAASESFNIYPRSSDSKYYDSPELLPDIVYTTSGTENMLGGNVYTLHGTVTEFVEMDMGTNGIAMSGFSVKTELGTVVIHDMIGYLDKISTVSADFMRGDDNTDYTMPQIGEEADFICIYNGFSDLYECPYFYFGCDEELVYEVFLDWQGDSSDINESDKNESEIVSQKTVKTTNESQPADNERAETSATGTQLEALSTANSYLSVMPFSHSGLIEQLEYEGFSSVDATYAADNCGADWNEQALLCAKDYLNTLSFSYSGLLDQLEYEGFTSDQATYGADNCGADWDEQAVKTARTYLDIFDYSRSELIDQLVFEGFTYDQAEYGASQNGL